MSYTTPLTAVSNAPFTAAQYNASDRDNMLVTPAALASATGRIFVTTGANSIAERVISTAAVATSQSTASTTFTNLATVGPQVTVTTGANALVIVASDLGSDTASSFAQAAYEVTGATTIVATTDRGLQFRSGIANQSVRASCVHMETALTPGSNVFTMKYETSSGGGNATFTNRRLTVMAL
jgi:hypothetical protein